MKKLETKLKEKVQVELKTLTNIWFFKTSERSLRGIPDIIICLNGYFVAIELKAENSASRKAHEVLQDHMLQSIEEKGKGIRFKVTPGTWPLVFRVLKGLDSATPISRIPPF